jgi:hypothetical protein
VNDLSNLTFAHHGPADTDAIVETVIVPIYEATHADVINDPFYSAERFVERVRGYLMASPSAWRSATRCPRTPGGGRPSPLQSSRS